MARPLRIGVVAGEHSGDQLGARVLDALGARRQPLVAEGVGGSQLRSRGLCSLYAMERLSVMGLAEPLRRLPELLAMRRGLCRHFLRQPPDVLLTIDAPDFNLPLARRLRRAGVPAVHLVSPSVWAWRPGRLRAIGRSVDLMLCLLPFEPAIYAARNIPAQFVGHPLADELAPPADRGAARRALGETAPGPLVALLPGSRESEIRHLGPLFLEAALHLWRRDPAYRFLLPAADQRCEAQLAALLAANPALPVRLLRQQSRDALAAADAALVASGTATLEAALLGCPMVVAYRMGTLNWRVLSTLLRTPYVALPNILAGREVVPELLQGNATPAALALALADLRGPGARDQVRAFAALRAQLAAGCAAQVAQALLVAAEGEGKRKGA